MNFTEKYFYKYIFIRERQNVKFAKKVKEIEENKNPKYLVKIRERGGFTK